MIFYLIANLLKQDYFFIEREFIEAGSFLFECEFLDTKTKFYANGKCLKSQKIQFLANFYILLRFGGFSRQRGNRLYHVFAHSASNLKTREEAFGTPGTICLDCNLYAVVDIRRSS